MTLGRRLRTRMKIIAWVIGAFAVLVTFIADDVDSDSQVTPDSAPVVPSRPRASGTSRTRCRSAERLRCPTMSATVAMPT